jgi:hypothetical protein
MTPSDLLTQAVETRRLADVAPSDTIRWQLVSLAKQFEGLADQLDGRRTRPVPSRGAPPARHRDREADSAWAYMLDVVP